MGDVKLVTRVIEAGPPITCEDCGTNWITLSEENGELVIGCPKCYEIEENRQ